MKTLNLVFDKTGWQPAKEDKDKSIPEVSKIVIENIVYTYATQQGGFQEPERRQWYKVLDALEKALKAGQEAVELEDDAFGFLRKCVTGVKVAPNDLIRKIDGLVMAVENR